MKIDVTFDFTTDTPRYWEGFWDDEILGKSVMDPDKESKTLQTYHKNLWSKVLPNGEIMSLNIENKINYLSWKNFRFGSDSIIVSFRYKRYRKMLEEVANNISDYQSFIENYVHKAYTIGGSIIFPKENSINKARGISSYIRDRWDLTLECIRRYYNNENSPLYQTLLKNKDFFDLFVDFKGYVNFFYLQDCVTPDYQSVIFWIGDGDFSKNPLPKTVDEYLTWIDKELEFVSKRNKRIEVAMQD